ncbi:sacsin-like, partial [Gigantopelta aegis]|uniref:sacsin-like n=1 Tax=Gigantopelta aegis TaxID=1735272 RepID=UPI001B88C6C0
MHSCYYYLKNNTVTEQDKVNLQAFPVIYLLESDVMVRARDIVIDLHKDEAIRGYIFQPPVYFGQFYSVFESLGASKNVSANHYAEVLEKMHQKLGTDKLNANEWLLVQKAVLMLFKCLTDDNYVSDISISTLYLPSKLHTLVCASDLVLSNSYVLQTRVESLGLTYFIGFNELKLDVTDPVGRMRSLPERHRPQILTSLVQEHITTECQKQAYTGVYASKYMRTIKSSPFVSGVIRLVNHQLNMNHNKPISDDQAKQIDNMFQNVQLWEVNDLKTHLVYSKSIVPNSESSKKCFEESICHKDTTESTICLYLDTRACQCESKMCCQISQKIDRMLKGQIGSAATHMEKMLLMDGGDIASYLDEHEIISSNFRHNQSNTPVFPPPGTLIPEEFHWMLDNNFDVLFEDEYVGLEVYDPLIDEAGKTAEESLNAVYIYAIVKGITNKHACPMMMMYLVEVGDGRIEELHGTKLYKLCRDKSSTGQELVLSSASPSSPDDAELDLNEILKKIRQTLKEAWASLDVNGRKRVIKRLYLKWHPDKNNASKKDLCTKVCQYIQLYMSKLDNGESIDDIDEKDTKRPPTYNKHSSFFDFMDRRSSSHRSHYNNYRKRNKHQGGSS